MEYGSVTPEGKKDSGLDKLGLAIEIAKADGNPDWDNLAVRLGSASAASLKKTWTNLKNNYIIRRKGDVDTALSPKPAKVVKVVKSKAMKAPRKTTAVLTVPKKRGKKAVVEDEDEDGEYDEDVGVEADTISGLKGEE